MKPLTAKKSQKEQRIHQVLMGLVEHYIKTGVPVGSKTLKEAGFRNLGAATLRNYFAHLEENGLLTQLHASGGRIPTHAAFRLYANEYLDAKVMTPCDDERMNSLRKSESRKIATYLQKAAELLSEITNLAVVMSAPRFDYDFITHVKLVPIDQSRCLCVMITDFGVIQTELLHIDQKITNFSAKRIEDYFHWRLTGYDKPEALTKEEEAFAQDVYNELMVRHIVSYSNFIDDEVYRTGFSKLISYPDFTETTTLANSLALFENAHSMRLLMRECTSHEGLKFWIGDDLKTHVESAPECALVAVPYRIGQQNVGAFGVMGPARMPYRELFGILNIFADSISEALTRNIYKFKITFRKPESRPSFLQKEEHRLLDQSRLMLLEDKRKEEIGE